MVPLTSILCSLLLINFVQCDDGPPVPVVSKDQIKEIGQEAEFNCTVEPGQYSILWVKLDKEGQNGAPLSNGADLIIKGDRKYSLRYIEEENIYSLKVKDLVESDTGFYQCLLLVSSVNRKFNNVELQIRRPPTIINVTTSGNVTENQPIDLNCKADGYPIPTITWRREGNVLFFNGGSVYEGKTLSIPRTRRDDRGVYTCTATNGVGKTVQASTRVVIEFSPIVTTIKPRIGQALGYDVDLECSVEAHPAPTITWLRNDKELRKEDFQEKPDEFVDHYRVYSVDSTDYGVYVCRADNKWGSSETKIELIETQIPIFGSI